MSALLESPFFGIALTVLAYWLGVQAQKRTGLVICNNMIVSVALLTVYDMCKAVDKRMVIGDIHLVEKQGGKSGDFRFEEGNAG